MRPVGGYLSTRAEAIGSGGMLQSDRGKALNHGDLPRNHHGSVRHVSEHLSVCIKAVGEMPGMADGYPTPQRLRRTWTIDPLADLP
ncbi:hypothetical protein CUJ84_Chr004662 [Rhizobium leguminosarum]|uniref:Uncharacterized protein n=1 Tax=Rhizobium leguminosarum TaxID=384 RepID=A0A2K9Z9P3_RHILE|nr:hypothetical protein CUJ84_Chr004662 [Rhizobium leguminosarum]